MPTFDTPEPIMATIELAVGDVRLRAGAGGQTVVDVRPTDPSNADDVKVAEQTRVEYAHAKLLVKAPKQRTGLSRGGGPSIDVTVELPAGSRVHANVGSADVTCDGTLGDCRIKTGLGNIRLGQAAAVELKTGIGDVELERATGHAEVTTGSGDVRLGALDATAVVKNSNGDTWIGVAGGDLRVKAANGSVAVDVARGTVGAKSANGDIRLGEAVRGAVVLETQIGDLEVGIREGTAAWLDLRTTAGKVLNSLETSDAPSEPEKSVEVRARTVAGNVVIRRP